MCLIKVRYVLLFIIIYFDNWKHKERWSFKRTLKTYLRKAGRLGVDIPRYDCKVFLTLFITLFRLGETFLKCGSVNDSVETTFEDILYKHLLLHRCSLGL